MVGEVRIGEIIGGGGQVEMIGVGSRKDRIRRRGKAERG